MLEHVDARRAPARRARAIGETTATSSKHEPGREEQRSATAASASRGVAACERGSRTRRSRARPARAAADRASSRVSTPPDLELRRAGAVLPLPPRHVRVREVEARYLGKLGFNLVARHGRIGEEYRRSSRGSPGRSSTTSASSCACRSSSAAPSTSSSSRASGSFPASTTSGSRSTRTSSPSRRRAQSRRSCASRSTAAAGRSSPRTPATGSRCIRPASGSTSCSGGDVFRLTELHLLADDPEAKASARRELLDAELRRHERDGRRTRSPLHPAAARRGARSCDGELFI